MKLDIVQRKARKKDFWDLHELLHHFSLAHMIELHSMRYPHTHESELLISNLTEFNHAEDDFDPICVRGKHWELIKLDIARAAAQL